VLRAEHLTIMRSAPSLSIQILSIISCGSTSCVARTTVATLPEYSSREKTKVLLPRPGPRCGAPKGANSLGRKAREFVCSPFGTR
jgi:hypothetical protein